MVNAAFRDDQSMAETIVRYQPRGLEPLLANLVAFSMRLIQVQGDGDPEPVLAMWRILAEAQADEARREYALAQP